MKQKLTLLILALFTTVGAWADGLLVSTTESASAEYQYKIFCRNASEYYLGNTTNATNSGADYGLFAFFEDTSNDYTNGYYIYSIFEGKWVTYTAGTSYSGGTNKISLVADKPSVPWHIAADNSDDKYYDIRPFKTDDKTADTQSWNWYNGAANNTSNTMGFYSYTNDNSGWGIVLAGGSGSPVADRKVVALYNVPTDENLYALYNSSGTPKVSSTTGTTPQYFVLRQNGLDYVGEAIYTLQKAEGDGKYLHYQEFSTDSYNYTFLNSSSYFYSGYTYGSGYTAAESPYYNLYRVWPSASNNSSRPYSNQVSQCNDKVVDMYSGTYNDVSTGIPAPLAAKGSWNGRWKVNELASYTAWQVVITGGAAGTVTYSGSALISGGTATQSNNGIFVLNATPIASDFTASVVDGYLTDRTITIDSNRKIIKVAYTNYSEIYNTITTKLSTAQEGVGYPTATARARMQAAIDVFDESSKVTMDLTTLSTAYNSFLTNVMLPEGKVYTIQNYIKSPSTTTYLKNEDGTLTIGATASETALNNLWVVRKSGNNYVLQSAADPTKYIVYNSFTLAATGSTWTLSCGTEWPYISLYSTGLSRYIACNGNDRFGTANRNYYASDKTQASGWSTDFKFVESTDYALYKVKIIYPSGSAPTVTYNETAYSNGSDFVAPKTLKTTDLTVSSIDGYDTNVSIDGDIIYVHYNVALNNLYADAWNFDTYPWLLLNNVPAAIDNPSRTYRYNTKLINVATTYNSSVVVKFAYTTGSYRIDVAGVDLIDPSTGDVVYYDYHDGYSGGQQSNREYTINNVAPGNYILRYISYDQSTSSAGNISVWITPNEGFYRIKGYSNNYITSNTTGNNASMNGTATINIIVYYSSSKNIIFFANGYGMYNTHTVAPVGSTLNEYSFLPGAQAGKYYVKSNYGDGGTYCYDNTNNGTKVDRNSDPVTSGNYETDWTVEEVTSLPVTIGSTTYATLYAPVALTIPANVQAYYISSLTETEATLTEITSTIAANTSVILKATETGTYNFVATTGGSDVSASNKLSGQTTAFAVSADDVTNKTYYTLQRNEADTATGLYPKTAAGSIAGFKAYLLASNIPAGVKGFNFIFEDDPDAISLTPALSEGEGAIYNLAGQRLNKMQKGINIVNGKKILK